MAMATIVLDNLAKADALASGDRSFHVIGSGMSVSVGDFIHFAYTDNGVAVKHPVSSMIYVITHLDQINQFTAIINVKPVISWDSHLKRTLDSARIHNDTCSIVFYGSGEHKQYRVKSYNNGGVILTDEHMQEIHREFETIAEVSLLHSGVVL